MLNPWKIKDQKPFTGTIQKKIKGGFNPEGSQSWIAEIEKIFIAMTCADEKSVTFATFMLVEEAENW